MTVCLYLNPGVPFLISDCLITVSIDKKIVPSLRPDNIDEFNPGKFDLLANLTSKAILLDPSTFVAFAGDSEPIMRMCQYLPDRFRSREAGFRPMEFVGMIADEVNSSPIEKGTLSVIGAGSMLVDGKFVTNFVYPPDVHFVKTETLLGDIWAIGTGAKELTNRVIGYSKATTNQVQPDQPDKLTYRYVELLGALNGEYLFGKKIGNEPTTWGGYLEGAIFNAASQEWNFCPSWAHGLVIMDPNQGGAAKFASKLFFYQRGRNGIPGGLRCYKGNGDGNPSIFEWQIDTPSENGGATCDWSNLEPEFATITFVNVSNRESPKAVHITLTSAQRTRALIKVSSKVVDFVLDPKDFADLVDKVTEATK